MSIPQSVPDNPVSDWGVYFQTTLTKPLHPLFFKLEPFLPPSGKAVDMGCGAGHAVVWLAGKGWEIEAIDGHPQALEILATRLRPEERTRVTLCEQMLEAVTLKPDSYHLVVAAYSLFFIQDKASFRRVWEMIRAALKPGGLFLGEFLGTRDDWASEYLTNTPEEVQELLAGMEILHLEEAEQEGFTSQGTAKHWHIFHVIARSAS